MALNIDTITTCLVREIVDYLDTKDILNLALGIAPLSYVRYWVYTENIIKHGSSIIHIVAKRGKVDTLKLFQDIEDRMPHLDVKWECRTNRCADPNATDLLKAYDLRGWTPIHTAAYFGNQDVVTFLAKKGNGINSEDDTERKGRSPLLYAALSKDPHAMVPLMKKLGCDIDQTITPNGLPLLAYLCLKKNFPAAKAVIKGGADLEYQYPGDIKNMIHLCCAYEIVDMSNSSKFRRPHKEVQSVHDNNSDDDSDNDSDRMADSLDDYGRIKDWVLEAIVNDPDAYFSDYLEENDFYKAAGRVLNDEDTDEREYSQSSSVTLDCAAFDTVLRLLIRRGVDATAVDALGHSPAHYAVLFPQEEAYWNAMSCLHDGGEDFLTETSEGGTAVGALTSERNRELLESFDERINFFLDSTEVSMDWIQPDMFMIDWADVAKRFQADRRYDDFDRLRARMSMETEDNALDGYDSYWGVGKFADE